MSIIDNQTSDLNALKSDQQQNNRTKNSSFLENEEKCKLKR